MNIKKRKPTKKYSSSKKIYKRHTVLSAKSTSPKRKNLFGKFLKKIFQLSFAVCIVLGCVYVYRYSKSYLYANEKFFIDNIEVVGCNNVTETEIKNLIPFKVGDSLLKINLSETKKQLKSYKPELKNVSMSRKWKEKKVIISLKEREPEVFIIENENKIGLDFDNKPFALRGNMFDMSIPTLFYSSPQDRESLLEFFKKFKSCMSEFVPYVTEIKYGEVEDIVLKMNDKTIVYWGHPQHKKIKEKAQKIKAVLNDLSKKSVIADYIDLTLIDNNKNRIIVKPSVSVEEEQKKV